MTYQIKLAQFEGPFDLLLFFIQRDEIDIYDIPISKLANDFLSYLHEMELLNIELASEFMLVAASLMRIKAKMLLPRKELNEDGEEIDPRAALVQKLLEYKQFKLVVGDLDRMASDRAKYHRRGNLEGEIRYISEKYNTESELESLNLYKLMNVFGKVMERYRSKDNEMKFAIVRFPYTIEEQRDTIQEMVRLETSKMTPFEKIFDDCDNKILAIYRFLAILELVQQRFLRIRIGEGYNSFWLLDTEEEISSLENGVKTK